MGELNSEEFAIIENIEYKMSPYRSAHLTLALTDRNNVRTNKRIKLHHHDLNNIPDFIVLREFYDISVGFNFQTGDEVEGIIDDKWWIGTIQGRIFEEQGVYNNSQLNSIEIKWESEPAPEKLSPWELQPLTPGRRNDTSATEEDHELFSAYTVIMEDWPLPPGGPDVGRNTELARDHFFEKLKNAIQQLNRLPPLSPFQHPVTLQTFPDYADIVTYPIDLQTITERISKKYYRTLAHLKKDIQMIAFNANKYNQRSSDIAINSKRLIQTLFHILATANPPNASEYFYSLEEVPPAELTAYEQDLSLKPLHETSIRRSHRSASSANARGEFQSSKNIKDVWMTECRNVCNQVIDEQAKELLEENEEEENIDEILQKFEQKKYKSPNELLAALTVLIQGCLSNFDRRRAEHRSLNTLNQNLENKFKPIIEKFNRMANERTNIRQKRAAAVNASSAWRNDKKIPQTSSAGSRELRTRKYINGEQLTRRSSRPHQEVNYAELNQGNVSRAAKNEDDLKNGYLHSQPGPSRRSQSNIRSPSSRIASKTPPSIKQEEQESFENIEMEEEIPAPSEEMLENIQPNTVASSPSVDHGNDSDYVGEEDIEEPDYEEEAVPEAPLSSESEETAVSTGNSSTSSRPRKKKITRGKRRGRVSSDTASSRSSEENIRKSKRKRKAKARQDSPEPPPRKKAKPQPRRSVRSNANRRYNEDSDDEEEEYQIPSTTRSGRKVQRKRL
uniref:Bromo domain-containing protein n=1 Tax=Panagrolaimus sp. ES5 TaxID=591445 RepID=A0AC34FPB8_9BILA